MALLSVILAHPRHGSFNHAIAATVVTFGLVNSGTRAATVQLLLPYEASSTVGTGFTEPLSFAATSGRAALKLTKGPEQRNDMFTVRSQVASIALPANSMA